MKKSILLFAVALGMLTSCDPQKDDKSFDVTHITADALLNGAEFSQYADAECTTPAADGNYIKFNCPNVSALTIYYLKPDGSEGVLSTGKAGGVFNFVPKRGSDPNQTVYFRYVNQDGEAVEASRQFTVQVAGDLAPEIKLLVSDEGKKVWKWDLSANEQAWGNMAYAMGPGEEFALAAANQWWGCVPEALWSKEEGGQYGHTDGDDSKAGEGDSNAYMIIDEDGKIATYDASGKVLRSGTYSIENYTPDRIEVGGNPWHLGTFKTSEPVVMFPYKINGGGTTVTEFQILQLTPGKFTLVYPGDAAAGSWAEATFWRFASTSDVVGCLTDNGEATWAWDDDNGLCWGNGGYGGFVYGGVSSVAGNSWWGVPSSDLGEQISSYGYGQADGAGATMTLTSDGLIKKSSGGSGSYELDLENKSDIGGYNEGKTLGRFKTKGDGILFPVRINAGTTTDEFDIVYVSDNNFVLSYPNYPAGGDNASWMEGTFWRFKKVK